MGLAAWAQNRHSDRQRRERDLIRKLQILTRMTITLQPGPGEQPAA
jgi:hypothetical protein